jgi:hypothetical protein
LWRGRREDRHRTWSLGVFAICLWVIHGIWVLGEPENRHLEAKPANRLEGRRRTSPAGANAAARLTSRGLCAAPTEPEPTTGRDAPQSEVSSR